MEVRSTVAGGFTFSQCAPASVVRKIVPLPPTIQQMSRVGADPVSRSLTTPLDCTSQVAPESVECSMIPAGLTRQSAALLGAEKTFAADVFAARSIGPFGPGASASADCRLTTLPAARCCLSCSGACRPLAVLALVTDSLFEG